MADDLDHALTALKFSEMAIARYHYEDERLRGIRLAEIDSAKTTLYKIKKEMTMSRPEIVSEAVDELALRPLHGTVDHRFAGAPIDTWRGYSPEPSVVTAIEMAVKYLNRGFIAFVMELPYKPYETFIEHQKRGVIAYAAENYPGLKIKAHTERNPFRGVGSDCQVFYVVAGEEKMAPESEPAE